MAKSGTLAEARPSKRAWCHPSLKKFLQENDAYDAFIANCKAGAQDWNPDKRFFENLDAFSWSESKEGFRHWNDLFKKHNGYHYVA